MVGYKGQNRMISKIVRISIIGLCLIGVGIVAWLSYQEIHKLETLAQSVDIDFKQYPTVDAVFEKGIKIFEEAFSKDELGGNTDIIYQYLISLRYINEVLHRKPKEPEALMYAGIINGMLSSGYSDMGLKLETIRQAFEYLDMALELNDQLHMAYYYRGIFSAEVPDTIFRRLKKGISDLERVYNLNRVSPFLSESYYYNLLYYLGLTKNEDSAPSGNPYLNEVIEKSNDLDLIKKAKGLLR